MANNLTGDFDVVAEFAVLAVDRLLAAMHQTGRFLHSISARVDDNPRPTRPHWPVVVGAVDAFGDAVANQLMIGRPNPFPGAAAANNPLLARLGVLVNPGQLVAEIPPIVPSHISGIAQIQLFPPTVIVPDASGTNLTVRMNLMARFFPDKDTAPLAEFIRGDLQITAPVNKIASGHVHVLDIDFKADEAIINFTPSYTSKPLTAEDLAGINLCIRNGLMTSFLPSSVVLPSSIANVQLKTLPGAVVVMLDFNDHASTASSVTNVFMAPDDDFAFAVGRDYLLNTLRMVSDNILSQTFPPATFTVNLLLETLHYSYPITLNSASFDLQPGKIVLTIQGHAGPEAHGHHPDSFSFTVTVEFSLLTAGPTVSLLLGNVSVDTSSTLADILDYFTGDVTSSVKNAVSAAMSATGAGDMVNQMFNADTNLGKFLTAQLTPPDGSPPTQAQQVFLVYNSVDIQPAGVVLHGSLIVFDWPDPSIDFEIIPSSGNVVVGPIQGTDYSALKTWIPGGTIAEYQWKVFGQSAPFDTDPNRFVLLNFGSMVATGDTAVAERFVFGYSPLCLTVVGSRISNYGTPATFQQVTATSCGHFTFPFPPLQGVFTKAAPVVTVVRPGPEGNVIASGQTSAIVDRTGTGSPNLLVHFADASSLSQLPVLTQALEASKRKDAPTAVMAVLSPDHLTKAPYAPGVVYSEDQDGRWLGAFGVGSAKPPLTLIVDPRGKVLWKEEGALDAAKLSAALAKHLTKRGPIKLTLPRANARIGQPAPNFLFEYTLGREMPLTKISGQPIVLVFWRSASKASIQAVLELQTSAAKSKPPALVLAINDGDDPRMARAVAAESGFTAIVVVDPKREIGTAYGVTMWPTIISLDKNGVITGVRNGHVAGVQAGQPVGQSGPPKGTRAVRR